jgi:hypothetical protein
LTVTISLLLGVIGLSAFAAEPPRSKNAVAGGVNWVGLRGPNGTGIYPDAKPPTSWDITTGKNVRWIAPLDGWGQGQPVIADGKIFLMLEPDVNHLFARLQCRDVATGKVLWEDMLDHLSTAIPDGAKREEVRKQWTRLHQLDIEGQHFERDWNLARTSEEREATFRRYLAQGYAPLAQGGLSLKPATKTSSRAFVNPARTGITEEMIRGVVEAMRNRADKPFESLADKKEYSELNGQLKTYGLWSEIYQTTCNFNCIGKTFGAPAWCDGAVYVATAGGVFAKYDKDGKRQWLTFSWFTNRKDIPGLGGAGHDTCVRSPIVYGDLFISTGAENVVALDRATGKVRFKDAIRAGTSIASPVVLTVAKNDILLTAGAHAYCLPDGKPLKVEGWLRSGMQALVKDDERDVVFFCGSGQHCAWSGPDTPPPAAVRYILEGDTLKGKVIWSGVEAPGISECDRHGPGSPWLLYDHGRLYHPSGAILDALNGEILGGRLLGNFGRGKPENKAVPGTGHLLQLAGGHVYGWNGKVRCPPEVFTADGKFVAQNAFPRPTLTKEQLPIYQGVDSRDHYSDDCISYSSQFTFGPDCLVMRALMHLYCFSEGSQLPAQSSTSVKQP